MPTFRPQVRPRIALRVEHLPLIARLARIGFHRYRSKWTKRLFKRPGRMLFDFVYGGIGLGGRATAILSLPDKTATITFDARELQYKGIYQRDLRHGYEPEISVLLDIFLTGNRTFYDVGSNWGYFAVYAATVPGYSGQIHAFEPIRNTFTELTDWVGQAGLEDRIQCHRTALSNRTGLGEMTTVPGASGLATLEERPDADFKEPDVPLARLDDMAPPPDLLKIDVEGHEISVFEGGDELFRKSKPMVVFENWLEATNPAHTKAPLQWLVDNGYLLFEPRWRLDEPISRDFWPGRYEPCVPSDAYLVYVPFAPDDRLDMRDQINVFACHSDRLSELEAVMTKL